MKKTIKIVLILVVIAAITTLGLYFGYSYKKSKKLVSVAPLSNIGTAEYWGDSIESYGQVTADKSQMGYLPKGSEVLSVNVSEGDHVEEGDVIISVKKDRQDLDSKKLEIARANHNLSVEQKKLDRLMKTKPVPTYVYSQEVYKDYKYIERKIYVASTNFEINSQSYKSGDKVAEEVFDIHGSSLGMSYFVYNTYDADGNPKKDEETGEVVYDTKTADDNIKASIKKAAKDGELTVENKETTQSYHRSTTYFDYETNKVVGEINYTIDGEVESEKKQPEGMNAKDIEEAIIDEQNTIKKLDLDLRKLQYEYETILNTTDDGQVYAKVSGTVSKLQDVNNFNSNQPFFVITATDEYFITGSIGEFYLNQIKVGDEVSISSWDTGNTAEAKVTSISDTPAEDGGNFWGGSGSNTNSSNYEFKASFDKNSGIEIGSAVDISITPKGEEEKGFYIPNYVIRKDAGGSYVMKMNDEEKLEKVYVKVGKTVWGSMVQIKSGITIDDYVSFPYGDGAIEGVKCKQVEYLGDDGGLG